MGILRSRLRLATIVAILMLQLSMLPLSSAESHNNYPYSGAVDNPYSNSGSVAITHSNDGSIVAVGFHRSVGIFDPVSRTYLNEVDVGDGVRSIAFSEDDSIMFVGIESPMLETLAVALFHTSDWQRFAVVDDGHEVRDLGLIESERIFAAANEQYGINEYSFDDPSQYVDTYEGGHAGHVNCIGQSGSGDHMVSGSDDGSVIVWDREDQSVHLSWQSDNPITDCSFSPDGSMVIWVAGPLLQVRSMPSGEYLETITLSDVGEQISWNNDGSELWVLTAISGPVIRVYGMPQFNVINTFEIGHRSEHFSLSPSNHEIIVTTKSSIISIYSDVRWQPGYGELGADKDMDGIPNIRDPDDDGDGIGDIYEYVCDEGSDCDLHPDINKIRSVEISFSGTTMTILDMVQLNSTQSAPLRDLSAGSVSTDSRVDQGEALRMQGMLCGGTGTQSDVYSAAWIDAIGLEGAAVVSVSVICDSRLGLVDTEIVDSKTRIRIRWYIDIELSNPMARPFNLTYIPGVPAPAGTVSMATPTSPVRLSVIHQSELVYVSGPIYPTDSAFTIHVEAVVPDNPTIIDIAIEWAVDYYWVPAAVLAIMIIMGITTVRRRNRIQFDWSDEGEETVSRRRKSRPIPEEGEFDDEPISTSGKPQPLSPPTQARAQPNRPPPDQRAVRKVRKTLGTVTQTGEAPEGESWDYGEHGAYWDSDDPDKQDPYGEAHDIHEEGVSLHDLAKEMSGQSDTAKEPEAEDVGDFPDALSMLTADKPSKSDDEQPEVEKAPRKKRRAPKRKKKKK